MIRSMTGYARVEQQGSWGRLSWELRSVNHRYLDLQIKLPEEFRALENQFRLQATARVSRGKVEAALRYAPNHAGAANLHINHDRLTAVCSALDVVSRSLRTSTAPDPIRLLAWPGVVNEDGAAQSTPVAEAAELFTQALNDFTDTRAREGDRLLAYLYERLDAMSALVDRVRARGPQVRDLWVERLRQRCAELGVEIEPARLAQEVALAAQRLDVDEEMSRLTSHFIEVRETLLRDESVGRRLDFLMQELNREANTLSSKSQDAEMTRHAVDMKVMIEQMREQIQNIE